MSPADESLVLTVARRNTLSHTESLPRERAVWVRPGTWIGVLGLWSGAALLAATTSYLSLRAAEAPPTWLGSLTFPAAAGALWVPLTVFIVWAARRFPPFEVDGGFSVRIPSAVAHLAFSLTVTFVVNAGFLLIVGRGSLAAFPELAGEAVRMGTAFLHLNAGVYWAIVLLTLVGPALRGRGVHRDRPEQTLTVRSGKSRVRVRISEISWIEGAGDYVRLHLGDTEHLLSERLKVLERRLDGASFVRVHRSAIVNVSAIERLRHVGRGDYEARLRDGSTVRVSRTRRAELERVLEAREVPAPGDERG